MTGLLVFLIIGFIVLMVGLYNLGVKARKLEQSDEDFLQNQLQLAKNECYNISEQFARYLADQRRSYLINNQDNESGYEEWMTKGVETFFYSTVSPKLVDVQRECLIEYSAYPEIIEQVAASAEKEVAVV